MRNIKFRGFSKKEVVPFSQEREWVVGNLLTEGGFVAIHNGKFPVEVVPETVGQFTGLTDKNGKEIYEGDIIHAKGGSIDKDFGVVVYHKNGYFYIDDSFGEFPRDCVKPIGDFFDSIGRNDSFQELTFYVSGNIHNDKSQNRIQSPLTS